MALMPLLDDNLSIWKISFRWAGLNPNHFKYRFFIPQDVKDNMRLVLNAIYSNSLFCRGLQPKLLLQQSNSRDQNNLNNLHDVISDYNYDRNFLLSYSIWRADFAHWCNRSAIPFPEFWFSKEWTIHELSQLDMLIIENPDLADIYHAPPKSEKTKSSTNSPIEINDYWYPSIIAAQTIWSQDKSLSIADVIRKIKAMPELKASYLTESAIRKHIKHLSPIPGKPGRKPTKKLT